MSKLFVSCVEHHSGFNHSNRGTSAYLVKCMPHAANRGWGSGFEFSPQLHEVKFSRLINFNFEPTRSPLDVCGWTWKGVGHCTIRTHFDPGKDVSWTLKRQQKPWILSLHWTSSQHSQRCWKDVFWVCFFFIFLPPCFSVAWRHLGNSCTKTLSEAEYKMSSLYQLLSNSSRSTGNFIL